MLTVDFKKTLSDFTIDIAFQIHNNTTALFGPSGSGKTTILRCIAGLSKPLAGTIYFSDKCFFDSHKRIYTKPQHRRIGYMFQDYALFPHLSVKRNVLYGAQDQSDKTLFSDIICMLKIDNLLDRSTLKLSGGEKQRVALARVLMTQPYILLLDEPFSAIDNDLKNELQNEFKCIQKQWNIVTIIVTHDINDAKKLAQRIIYIKQGVIAKEEFNH